MRTTVPTNCLHCGETFRVYPCFLRKGRGKYCGRTCQFAAQKKPHTHGEASKRTLTRLYRIWCGMKSRCFIPSATGYQNYGAKGIKVCQEWDGSFEVFRAWAVAHGYREDLSLDRIDGAKDYAPENCRWADRNGQARNRMKTGSTSSRFKGVSWHRSTRAWQARILLAGRSKYLGVFASEEEAARVYDTAARLHFGEYAKTNF